MSEGQEKTTTAEALLGLLSLEPMTGYEIRKMVDSSIGNFWSESYGQIYPTLKRLEKEGAITSKTETQAGPGGGRESRRYALTDAGRTRLENWLQVPAKPQVPRHELLLKLFFGELTEVDTMVRQVGEWRQMYADNLARYQAIEAQLRKLYANHPGLNYWIFTLRYGIAEAEGQMRWADETLAELGRMKKKGSKGRTSHAQ